MSNKSIDIDYIWNLYKNESVQSAKQTLILNYIKLIKYTISRMVLPVNTILEEEDFINYGVLGLSEAIDRFELDRGVKFESYAIRRIKGRIQDEMRKLDWLSRSARKKANEYKNIVDTIQINQDKGVSESDIIKELNISPEQYRNYLVAASDAKATIPITDSSLKAIINEDEEVNFLEEIPDDSQDFLSDILDNEKEMILSRSIANLKENKRNVITLYYFENLNFKEIGQVLGVSESRVSQIHSETIRELRTKMNNYDNV